MTTDTSDTTDVLSPDMMARAPHFLRVAHLTMNLADITTWRTERDAETVAVLLFLRGGGPFRFTGRQGREIAAFLTSVTHAIADEPGAQTSSTEDR